MALSVNVTRARNDLDQSVLIKPIDYYANSITSDNTDLSYGGQTKQTLSASVTIYAQVTITNESHDYVKMGKLAAGDLTGVLRYQYTEETDGTEISPTVTPELDSEIGYAGERYKMKTLLPLTNQDTSDIIGYEFTAQRVKR